MRRSTPRRRGIFHACPSHALNATHTMMIRVPFHCQGGQIMPRGDKSSYTNKQKRKAEHIEEGYEERGVSKDEAEERAWQIGRASCRERVWGSEVAVSL